jgi:hypothetical protein
MKLLKKKQVEVVDPIQRLRAESEDALGIFKTTIDKISKVCEGVREEKQKEIEIIENANAKLDELSTIESSSEKMLQKIENLFKD